MAPLSLLDLWRMTLEPDLAKPYDVDAIIRRRRAEQNLRHAERHLSRSHARLASVLLQQSEG